MDVTLLGMVISVKPVHPSKAEELIDVTLLPMITLIKPVQPLKAE